jgi:4,4'-diaponeurosporenoate glycosyltransferase
LGNLFRDGGVEVFCYGGKGTIDFRMYPGGLVEILEGWGKNFGSGAASIGLSTFILISCWITGSFSASIGLLRSIINNTDILQAVIIFFVYGIQITCMLRRIGNFSYSIIILYPVGQLFFLFTFIYSLVMTLFVRRVTWKGRNIETGYRKGSN